MIDWLAIAGFFASGGVITVIGQVIISHMRSKTDQTASALDGDVKLKVATGDMAVKLMEIADDRVSHWQAENLRLHTELSLMRREMGEAARAISLLREVIFASEEERPLVEERALNFLASLGEVSQRPT